MSMELLGVLAWALFCFWLIKIGVTGRELFLFSTWIILSLSVLGSLVSLLLL